MLQISANGFISFGKPFGGVSPPTSSLLESTLENSGVVALLAPMWTDIVLERDSEDSAVFYQVYTKWSQADVVDSNTEDIVNRATSNIRQLTGKATFVASNVIVVTWSNVTRFAGSTAEVSLRLDER